MLAQKKNKKDKINGYGKASYKAETEGVFFKNWLLVGPVFISDDQENFPDEEAQLKAFKEDLISKVNVTDNGKPVALKVKDQEIEWKEILSEDDIVDLDKIYDGKDFAYAYALAEIISDSEKSVVLAVGSDDGIKVWHNGAPAHDNWIQRGITKDDDIIPLKLVKGSNQILLKVQDVQQGWSFSARVLDKSSINEQLLVVSETGDLDNLKFLIASGADVNYKKPYGLTPLHVAQINGREEIITLLKENGAKEEPFVLEESYVDELYSSLKEKELPGVAILIAKGDTVVYKKGFGYSDIKDKKPVTPETIFRIGSVTKQFTAAAILKLQEENLLNVNDKLSKYLPDFPRADEVTIHHLLTHTSGIHSYTSKPEFMSQVSSTISPDELINFFKNDPYDFSPGESYIYNNSAYFLLGYLIGKISGSSYADYLEKSFFDPLNMDHTGVHYAGIKLDNQAKGFSRNGASYELAIDWDMSWAGGAGALYSTVDDLLKWNNALFSGKVLNEESLKAAFTPVVLNNGEKPGFGDYGYGWQLSTYRGKDIFHHSGGLHGFLSQLAYFPQDKLTVVMFTNTSDPSVDFNPNKLAEAYLWKNMEPQPSYSATDIKPKNLDAFVGRYDFSNGAVMKIVKKDEGLFAQLSGQPEFPIFPSSENEFYWKVVEARIKFVEDENGEVHNAIFNQNGQELKVKRLPEDTIIDLNPLILDSYVGKYDFGNSMVVSVFKEKDKIFAQATNQPKFEIFPVSETDFVLKDLNAKITFIKETDGKVNKLVLHMNGADTEMKRLE